MKIFICAFITAYERDNESELDFAQARYHNYNLGRFNSPDPYKIAAEIQLEENEEKARKKLNAYLSQPQQWNRYVYTINNPMKYTDPTGEVIWARGSAEERQAIYQEILNVLGPKEADLLKIITEEVKMEDGSIALKISINDAAAELMVREMFPENAVLQKGMAKLLGSGSNVEARFDGNFINRNKQIITLNTIENSPAATIPAYVNPNHRQQIVLEPDAAAQMNSDEWRKTSAKLSDDGKALVFNRTMIFAHELGEAYSSLGGPSDAWKSFENTIRARNPNNQQRRSKH